MNYQRIKTLDYHIYRVRYVKPSCLETFGIEDPGICMEITVYRDGSGGYLILDKYFDVLEGYATRYELADRYELAETLRDLRTDIIKSIEISAYE